VKSEQLEIQIKSLPEVAGVYQYYDKQEKNGSVPILTKTTTTERPPYWLKILLELHTSLLIPKWMRCFWKTT
jgi:hypothetical protein